MAVHGEDGDQVAAAQAAAAAKEAATAQLKDAANGGDEEKARAALAAGADVKAEGEVGSIVCMMEPRSRKLGLGHSHAPCPRPFVCALTSAIRMDSSKHDRVHDVTKARDVNAGALCAEWMDCPHGSQHARAPRGGKTLVGCGRRRGGEVHGVVGRRGKGGGISKSVVCITA